MRGLSFAFLQGVRAALYRHGHGRWEIRFAQKTAGATAALAAADEHGRLLGILAFTKRGGVLQSWMTYVASCARGRGIARQLWRLLIAVTRPTLVRVSVISDRGLALMRSIAAGHPRVRFDITEDGKRKLRAVAA